MRAVGVDGCRGGWVAVWIDETGSRGFRVLHRIEEILRFDAASTAIDIPIGLPESGYRACDRAARALLGAGRSRVFLGARRPLLRRLGDYRAANAWAKSDGKGLSRQTFAILPKIADVDACMSPRLQDRVRETHPELVFQCLNGGRPLPGKKSPEGRTLRRNLVADAGFDAIDGWIAALSSTGAKADDLLDACACAIVALSPHGMVACRPEVDARGLRMEIWF